MSRRCAIALAGCAIALAVLLVATFDVGSTPGRPAAASGAATDGATLFVAKGCSQCHDGPDSRSAMGAGPPLVGADGWAAERRPGLDAHAYLSQSMAEPSAFISPAYDGGAVDQDGSPMPDLHLTDQEIDALVDYLLRR